MARILVSPHISAVARTPATVLPAPLSHPSGKRVINFTLGDPAKVDPQTFSTPKHIRDAAMAFDYRGEYASPRGHPRLVELLQKELGTEHIIIMNGGSEVMEKLVQALQGSLIMPSPCFPPYIEQHVMLDRRLRFYRAMGEIDLDNLSKQLRTTSLRDTSALLIINPNNPTGATYGAANLSGAIALATDIGLPVVADEVYHDLTFGEPPPRIRDVAPSSPVIEVGSMSKKYLMCGDRVGWIAFQNYVPEFADLEAAILKMSASRLCSNVPGQLAAIAALEGGTAHLAPMLAELQTRSALMVEALEKLPNVKVLRPTAGFYVWFGLQLPNGMTSIDFARKLGEEEAVYLLPGSGFLDPMHNLPTPDPYQWFRAVFLPPAEHIMDGMERLQRFVGQFIS